MTQGLDLDLTYLAYSAHRGVCKLIVKHEQYSLTFGQRGDRKEPNTGVRTIIAPRTSL